MSYSKRALLQGIGNLKRITKESNLNEDDLIWMIEHTSDFIKKVMEASRENNRTGRR